MVKEVVVEKEVPKIVEVEKYITKEVPKVVEGVFIIEDICNAIQFITADSGTSTKWIN